MRDVQVENAFPRLAAAQRRRFGPLIGHPVRVGDLYRAVAALEQDYVRAGYPLVRLAAPPQTLVDGGTFRVSVVDGFVETVDQRAVPRRLKAPVRRTMQGLEGRRAVRAAVLERKLLLVGQLPGAAIRSTLARGEQPGGARLVLDGRQDPLQGQIGSDNRLGAAYRDWGLNLQLTANSLAGQGEQAYLFVAGEPRLDDAFKAEATRRIVGGGLNVPLGPDGLALNPELTVSDTRPVSEVPILATQGKLTHATVRLIYPVVLTRAQTLNATLSLEGVRERQTIPFFGLRLSDDRLTVTRLDLAWSRNFPEGRWLRLGGTYSHGLDALGAGDGTVPISRGASATFAKLEGRLVGGAPLPHGLDLQATLRAQTGFGEPVPNSETFDLTGVDALSTFTAGALSSDGGWGLRAELARSFGRTIRGVALQASPYLFAAVGQLRPAFPDPFTARNAEAFGAGFRFAADNLPFGIVPTLGLEYGAARSDGPLPDRERLNVSIGVRR